MSTGHAKGAPKKLSKFLMNLSPDGMYQVLSVHTAKTK